jgi:hypothetical protein
MSQKQIKLLRKGARLYDLPYKTLKKAFKHISPEDKTKFLKEAKVIRYV